MRFIQAVAELPASRHDEMFIRTPFAVAKLCSSIMVNPFLAAWKYLGSPSTMYALAAESTRSRDCRHACPAAHSLPRQRLEVLLVEKVALRHIKVAGVACALPRQEQIFGKRVAFIPDVRE